jgi:hypothetical protein
MHKSIASIRFNPTQITAIVTANQFSFVRLCNKTETKIVDSSSLNIIIHY